MKKYNESLNKKIIAKEIIYFFATITLILIFWSFIEIRNYYSKKKVKTISHEISVIQLEIDKNEKNNYFKPETWKILITELTELAKNGSSDVEMKSYCLDFDKKFSKEKDQLIKKTKILKVDQEKLSSKINIYENYILKNLEKKNSLLIFSTILLSILYPIRLVFILIRWSLLTIKKNS